MRRLTPKEKKKIHRLLTEGKSLYFISRKLNLGKTTVYYHTRKIIGRKIKLIKVNEADDEKIGEFLGMFAGDGHYFRDKVNHKYIIRLSIGISESEIKDYYSNIITFVFGKSPRIYEQKSVYIIEISSKEVVNFIKKYLKWIDGFKTQTIKLIGDIDNYSIGFIKGFLRGLIDSDGYVRKERQEIYFGTVSKCLLENFTSGLKKFNFKFKVYEQKQPTGSKIFYKVRLSGDEVINFCRMIKPIKSV